MKRRRTQRAPHAVTQHGIHVARPLYRKTVCCVTHACMQAHARTHTHACRHTHAHTRMHTGTCTHAHPRTRTYAHARTHTHTRRDTHQQLSIRGLRGDNSCKRQPHPPPPSDHSSTSLQIRFTAPLQSFCPFYTIHLVNEGRWNP